MNKKSTAPANSDVANLNKKYEAWFNANLKKCILGVFGIVAMVILIIVIVFVCKNNSKNQNDAFIAELALATPENIETIIAKDADNPAVAFARMRCAGSLMQARKWKDAQAVFAKVVSDSNAAAFLRESAALAEAVCAEQSGDLNAAAAGFAKLAADNKVSAQVRSEAGYNAGRILIKKGDIKGAEKVLQSVVAIDNKDDMWIIFSRNTLTALRNGDFSVPAAKKGK